MADCHDEQIGKRLHAYELGVLPDTERAEFEIHLLECDFCCRQLEAFREGALLIRRDADAREAIGEIVAASADSSGRADSERQLPARRTRFYLPALAVAAIVLLTLILRPWHIDVRPTHEAIAMENRIAVMYFDNLADRSDSLRLGEMVTNLLITGLSESQQLNLVSSQRLSDLLKSLGKEDSKGLDRAVAMQAARAAQARWVLLGSILQTAPQLVISTQLVDITSGQTIASPRIMTAAGTGIFAAVDTLSVEVRNGLPIPGLTGPGTVADITTHSPDAYRAYLAGIEKLAQVYTVEAAAFFRQAIQYDSTFAMAYYYLANLTGLAEGSCMMAMAVKYSNHAGASDQRYIQARAAIYAGDVKKALSIYKEITQRYPDEKMAWFLMASYEYNRMHYDSAVAYLTEAITLDPNYKQAYNLMAYAYHYLGDFEKSMLAIDRYVSLAPHEANPYDSRGDLYARNGRLDQAIASYQQALAIKPDFRPAGLSLGLLYIYSRQYAEAERILRELAPRDAPPYMGRTGSYLAYIPLYQGRYEWALQVLDSGIYADSITGIYAERGYKHYLKALVFRERGNLSAALAEVEWAITLYHVASPGDEQAYRYVQAQFLAESGDFAEARRITELIRTNAEEKGIGPTYYLYAAGAVALAAGEWMSAVDYLEKAAKANDDFYANFMLGTAYLKAGMIAEAVGLFERQVKCYSAMRMTSPVWGVQMHYLLGQAYEASLWREKAMEQYRTYLTILDSTDTPTAQLQDARKRLAALQALP